MMAKSTLILAAICMVVVAACQVTGMRLFGVEIEKASKFSKIDQWMEEAKLKPEESDNNLLEASKHFKEIKDSLTSPQEIDAWQEFTDLTKILPDLKKCSAEVKTTLDKSVESAGLALPVPEIETITSSTSRIIAHLVASYEKECKDKKPDESK